MEHTLTHITAANEPVTIRIKRWAILLPAIIITYIILLHIDAPVAHWWKSHLASNSMTGFTEDAAEFFGSVVTPWPTLIAALLIWQLDPKHLRTALIAGSSAVITSLILPNLIKLCVQRTRPKAFDGNTWQDSFLGFFSGGWSPDWSIASFPSADTTYGFALAYILSAIYPRATPVFLFIAIGCGLSRFIRQAHFPSDIYAGALVGLVCGYLSCEITRRILRRQQLRSTAA